MPKNQSITRLTAPERKSLLKTARLVLNQPQLDIRAKKRDSELPRLPGRILIVTSRKVGTAPKRNLLRRRLKAIFYEEKLFQHSYDVVVYCRKSATDLSFEELKTLLLDAFSRLTTSALKN